MRDWKSVCAGAVCLGIGLVSSVFALAQEVSLELRGGTFTITGKLLSYDGDNFVVDSETLGTFMVSVEKFHCVRGDCPTETAATLPNRGGTLRIAGSPTIAAMLPGLIRKYAAMKTLTVREIGGGETAIVELSDADGEVVQTFEVRHSDASQAFEALGDGSIDIGASSRPISDVEIGALTQAGHTDMNRVGRQHVVALDGLVVILSRDNPINAISMEELARIFSGEVVDWSELGWEQQPINVYTHSESSGANATFASLVLEPFRRTMTPGAIAYSSDADIAEAIALDRAGIGFISFAQEHTAKPVGIKDGCGITHKPTRFAVKAGEYPLSRELYFYTTPITRADVADFVGFSVSEYGYDAVRDAGYINRGITISAFDDFIERIVVSLLAPQEDFNLDLMRQLARDLGEGTRLSSTIRYEQSGEVRITGESSQQLSAAIDYIARQDMTRNQVVLVGFSDSSGSFDANLAVSLRRANAVRDALLAPGRSELKADDVIALAYGELLPAACNDTSDGRSRNRRVEVWLVPRRGGPITLNRQP
jgi:phosphate transport system substrate-binding protein